MRTSLWLACSLALSLAVTAGCRTPQSHPDTAQAELGEATGPADSDGGDARSKKDPGPIHITLVATNDLHGWVHPHETTLPDGTMAWLPMKVLTPSTV